MPSRKLPSILGRIATWTGLIAGSGGAGTLAALALMHKPGTTVIAAGAATMALAAHAAGSAGKTLPGIIAAISNLLTSRIRVKADADVTRTLAETRADLARAGLDPARTAQAAEMLRALSASPDLPTDRRPTDETLIKLQGSQRRTNSSEPGTGPDTPGKGPRTRRVTASKVVPIRSDKLPVSKIARCCWRQGLRNTRATPSTNQTAGLAISS